MFFVLVLVLVHKKITQFILFNMYMMVIGQQQTECSNIHICNCTQDQSANGRQCPGG